MKKKRLKQWLAATMAATMVVTSAIASPVDVQAAKKTVTVSTQKEFDKAVKQSGVKTIIVKSKTLKKLAVKSGNHSKITLKVDAPKVKLENKAKFAKVKIVDASSVTESKSGNTYVISDKKLSVTAKKSIKSITYSASKGTLTLSGAAKVSSVKVTKNDGSVIKNNTKNAITVVLADGTKKTVKSGKKLTAKTSTPVKETEKLSYAGYELKWQDDFNGDQLNRNDWNVELHEAGWVNNELQEYVDSSENIQVKDGNLYLKPVQKKNSDGTYSYTSGRVNTQGKHDFKYGLFEARVKVPKGKGYLPAFWMMPTNENVYGQWPKCGEIDCMEVMGQENNKVYGTIHFGDPHSERQNTYTLSEGNFTDEYHTFSCEWEPGKIKWYVDGVLYHTADDWYTTTTGQGTITYPAPFDQPFYMILNLAVGGSWVGYPDDKTTFDDQAFVIDYVKAYQKDSYDENVKKPVKNVELRKPDAKGNYINNGDFAKA
ncbi:MAG: glycoside hydrolase family 16 protein, partial [Agathobacter sp.]|nr:glycoside hydrolase family 16 protein [Agathobacter sp.]